MYNDIKIDTCSGSSCLIWNDQKVYIKNNIDNPVILNNEKVNEINFIHKINIESLKKTVRYMLYKNLNIQLHNIDNNIYKYIIRSQNDHFILLYVNLDDEKNKITYCKKRIKILII